MKEPIACGHNSSSTSQTTANTSSPRRKPQPDQHPPSASLTINPTTKKTILATSEKSNQSVLADKFTIYLDPASAQVTQDNEE